MALPVYRYPLDKTGENPDNHVLNEPHSLTPKSRPTDVRVTAPLYGPFFAESVHVVDRANGISLVKGSDYKVTDLLQDPTLKFGKEIGQFIVITNGAVSNEIAISYQVLGGNYQNDASAVQHVFETFLNDTRPVDWTSISGKPSTFPPTLHIHLLEDIVGWGPVIAALDGVRDAILLHNTPMFEALIDWVSTRKFKWEDLTGTPTTLKGYGITDAVAATRRIDTLALSGLRGGGNLTSNLALSLADSGVDAGTYGSALSIPVITVDVKGRVTKVNSVSTIVKTADTSSIDLSGNGSTTALSASVKLSSRAGNRIQVDSDGIGVFDVAPPNVAFQYIDAIDGNDSNPGTRALPLRTFVKAVENIKDSGGIGEYSIILKANQTHIVSQSIPDTSNATLYISIYGDPKYRVGEFSTPPGYRWYHAPDLQRPTLDFQLFNSNPTYGYVRLPTLTFSSLNILGVRIQFPIEKSTHPGAGNYAFSADSNNGRLWMCGCDVDYRSTVYGYSVFRGGKFIWEDNCLYGFSGSHRLGSLVSAYTVTDNGFTYTFQGNANFPSFTGRTTNLYENIRYNNIDNGIIGEPTHQSLFGGTINVNVFNLG